VLQYVAVCCIILQCVAACGSVLQCTAVSYRNRVRKCMAKKTCISKQSPVYPQKSPVYPQKVYLGCIRIDLQMYTYRSADEYIRKICGSYMYTSALLRMYTSALLRMYPQIFAVGAR